MHINGEPLTQHILEINCIQFHLKTEHTNQIFRLLESSLLPRLYKRDHLEIYVAITFPG